MNIKQIKQLINDKIAKENEICQGATLPMAVELTSIARVQCLTGLLVDIEMMELKESGHEYK